MPAKIVKEFINIYGFDIRLVGYINKNNKPCLAIQVRLTGAPQYHTLYNADMLLADELREFQPGEDEPDVIPA